MANYDAIRVLGEGLLGLMREQCPLVDLDLAVDASFALASLPALSATAPLQNGFHLCLWRVGISGSPRNLPPRRSPSGLKRPSLPLDLHYLLVPAAADAGKQARMLGWAMRFMHDLPTISGETINRYVGGAPSVFDPGESVELIADPLAPADYLALWDRVKTVFQGGMTYLARMVLIDSELPEDTGRLVNERVLDLRRKGTTP
jgi:hypothetical protein